MLLKNVFFWLQNGKSVCTERPTHALVGWLNILQHSSAGAYQGFCLFWVDFIICLLDLNIGVDNDDEDTDDDDDDNVGVDDHDDVYDNKNVKI